jgi:N-acetylmuramoyl-L-alanine amidase
MTEAHVRFQRFLNRHKVIYFSAKEVLFLGASNTFLRCNEIPPDALWPNILPAIKAADEIRARVGVPVRILSGYRNAAYNRAVGGARNSLHTQFRALDLTARIAIPDLHRAAVAVRNDGIFDGGIGVYTGFIHIDNGPRRNWHG